MEQHPAHTFARVNTLKTDPGQAAGAMARARTCEYDFVRRDWLEENLVFELKAHPAADRLPSFQQGCFYIQDPSTLLAVRTGPATGRDGARSLRRARRQDHLHRPTHGQPGPDRRPRRRPRPAEAGPGELRPAGRDVR